MTGKNSIASLASVRVLEHFDARRAAHANRCGYSVECIAHCALYELSAEDFIALMYTVGDRSVAKSALHALKIALTTPLRNHRLLALFFRMREDRAYENARVAEIWHEAYAQWLLFRTLRRHAEMYVYPLIAFIEHGEDTEAQEWLRTHFDLCILERKSQRGVAVNSASPLERHLRDRILVDVFTH